MQRCSRPAYCCHSTASPRRRPATDGPFPGSKEAVGGFWMIRVKSRDEAIEWAKRCPAGANDVIEIRRVHEMEDFGPEVARQERELAGKIASRG
jgi:hypothetical protein